MEPMENLLGEDRSLFVSRLQQELSALDVERTRLSGELGKYTQLDQTLLRLPRELGWTIPLLPLTSRALLPSAQLTNTNELRVHLGDGWFTRCSAHHARTISARRQAKCRETMARLEERKRLLQSWLAAVEGQVGEGMPIDLQNVFSENEINELCTEEELEQWRQIHRENLKKYHAESTSSREDDEEMWRRLDELELMEYQNEELSKKSITSLATCKKTESPISELENREPKQLPELDKIGWFWGCDSDQSTAESDEEETEKGGRRLSFAEHIQTTSEDTSVIHFQHSDVDFSDDVNSASFQTKPETLKSPSDIYSTFEEMFSAKTAPKSILKNSGETFTIPLSPQEEFVPSATPEVMENEKPTIADVTECFTPSLPPSVQSEPPEENERPISLFKARRKAQHRSK